MSKQKGFLSEDRLKEMDGSPVWWRNGMNTFASICAFRKYFPCPVFVSYDYAEDERKVMTYRRLIKIGYKPYESEPIKRKEE